MNILDEANEIDKCFDNIVLQSVSACKSVKQGKSISTWVHQDKKSIVKIKELIKSVSDNLTIRAHRIMSYDAARSLSAQVSKQKCSARHFQNIRKGKFTELDVITIQSSLRDLWKTETVKLQRSEDVCKVIHSDDSSEHKRKRRVIYNVLCDELHVCAKKNLHNK